MRLLIIFFVLLFFYGWFIVSMELTPRLSWYDLPETVIMQIVAISHNKHALCEVNWQLFKLASKNNIDKLIEWPCVLSRNDHLDLMVKYAIANNQDKMLFAIKSSVLCRRNNAVSLVSFFVDSNKISNYLSAYKANSCEDCLKNLLPIIMFVYGCTKAHDNYKNKNIIGPLREKLSALQAAAHCQHISIARLFLAQEKQKIVDFNIKKGMSKRTPLHIAVCNQYPGMVALFCKNSERFINVQSYSGNTPLFTAITVSNNKDFDAKIKIIKILLSAGANPNIQMRVSQSTALIAAVSEQLNCSIIELILEKGARINMRNQYGNTALIVATMLDNYNVMELLCKYNADISIQNNNKETALRKAVEKNNLMMMNLLLKNNTFINIKNGNGCTLLMVSVHNNNNLFDLIKVNSQKDWQSFGYLLDYFSMTELLLEKGADPNIVDNDGDTALICAVRHDNIAMVKLLLQYFADPTIKNLKGEDAYFFVESDTMKKLFKKSKKPKNAENCILS